MKKRLLAMLMAMVMMFSVLGAGAFAAAEPEETTAPEETAVPEETAAPEATAEPETTAGPEVTAEPETTAEPEATAEPETTAEPEATAEPEITAEPEATDTPEATEEPAAEAAAEPAVRITAGGESRDYATIDEAWAAATQAGTATVTLLADVTAQDVLTVPAGASITFVGGEYTLTTACIHVDGGTLTVASGTVLDAGDGSSGKMGAIRIYAGLLTVNGGTMRGLNSGIYCDGGDTTINGGVIYGENGGLAVTDADSLTVNGGDISGGTAGIACTGDNRPVINGGSISGKGGGGMDISIGVIAYSGLVLTGGEISGGDAGVMSIGDTTVTGGSVTGTEGFGLLIGEDGSASLSGGAYAGVSGAVSCGGIDILGYPIESALTVNDLLAYGYGWYGADGALLTPAADEKTLAGPVTVGPLPVAPATPVLKVEGENVLLSSDPSDIEQRYDAPLTDGALIEGGSGRIVVPAEYVVEFPDEGVEITEQRYDYNMREMPDTPICRRYVFRVTDPMLTELNVTVSPNPDTPTWTKVIAHTYADFIWTVTDCAGYPYSVLRAREWTFYAAEDSSGVILDLRRAGDVEPQPMMKTGTAEDTGDGTYTLHSENGVIEFTMAPGGIPVHFTGETDGLIKADQYVVNSRGENYVQVYVKPGWAVVPANEDLAVSAEVTIDENDDGSDMLCYMLNADAAAEKGVESVTVRIEKLTSATLSVNEPDTLLAADPYGSDRSPILTDGDVIPPEGGWLLTGSGRWYIGDNYECALEWRAASYGEPGSEIYNWTYIYPLKDGVVNVTLGPDEAPAHWVEMTVDNPGQRDLLLSAYAPDQNVQFDSDTYSASMIVSNYMYIEGVDGSLLDRDDITDTVGIQGVTKYLGYGTELLRLTVDPSAEEISFTVKAPAGAITPEPQVHFTGATEGLIAAEGCLTEGSPIPSGAGTVRLKNGYRLAAENAELTGEWAYDALGGEIYQTWTVTADAALSGELTIEVVKVDQQARWITLEIVNDLGVPWRIEDQTETVLFTGSGSWTGTLLEEPFFTGDGVFDRYTGLSVILNDNADGRYSTILLAYQDAEEYAYDEEPLNRFYEARADESGLLKVAVMVTPVLKAEGENVLLSTNPMDVDHRYVDPVADGGPIYNGSGYIMMPAGYAARFPDEGVTVTKEFYDYGSYDSSGNYDDDYGPDMPAYHIYHFTVTDPALAEVTVAAYPNPDAPTWTKVTAHTYSDFYWRLTDCAGHHHDGDTADDEWTDYVLEDADGLTLNLSKAEGVKPRVTTGTAEDIGGGKYTLHSKDGVLEFTLLSNSIKVNVTGEMDGLVEADEYVHVGIKRSSFWVDVRAGYTVTPVDGNSAVSEVLPWNKDGESFRSYYLVVDEAAEMGADSVTVRVEKITSAVLSFSEPDVLLAEDPYGTDKSPILTNGDVIPAEGGWLLVGADCDPVFDDVGVTGELKAVSFDEPGTAIYKYYYIYPLKNGTVNVGMERYKDWRHWAEVTVENPGGRDLYLYGYAIGQDVQFQSETYTAWMILGSRVTIESVTGAPVTVEDIVPGEGVTEVFGMGDRIALNVDPAAEKVSFTVKAPADATPTPAPTATPEPTAMPEPTATAVPTATAAPAAAATAAPGATSPKTGDETALAPWALMLLGCGAALIAVTARRRERR